MELLITILKILIPVVCGALIGLIKWWIDRKKKDKVTALYEQLLSEKDKVIMNQAIRILDLEKKKKKLEKIIVK